MTNRVGNEENNGIANVAPWWSGWRLATRFHFGVGVLSALFLFSIACGLIGTAKIAQNVESLIDAHLDADRVQRINLAVADLQRLVSAYIASGDESTATATRALGKELSEQIAICVENEHGQDTFRNLSKMQKLLNDYLSNYGFLYEERKLRIELVNDRLLPMRMEIHDQLNSVVQKLRSETDSSTAELVLRASNDLSDAEGKILRFLTYPDGNLSNSALELINQARAKLTLASASCPASELEKIREVQTELSDFRQALVRVIQATQGYLAIDNVVMAGNSAEFAYQSNKVRELTDKKLADFAIDIRNQSFSALTTTLSICSAAILLSVLFGFVFTRDMVKPISNITSTFNLLSQGEVVDGIPGLERKDDIGDLARAANVFRSRNLQTQEDAKNLFEKNIQIRQLLAESQTLAKKANSANQSKSEFLANMSHEIRTPMTAIVGFSEILVECVDSDEAKEAAGTIRRNGQHLLEIINDILDLSKIESGNMSVEGLECDPRAIAIESQELMKVRAEAKDIRLSVEIDPATPSCFTSDPTRIRQILVNLIGNAIKFTELGCIHLFVRYDKTGNKMAFEVTDTGIGMSQEQIGRLFKPFSQADTSVTRRFGGTGLGLSICKRLAELLGGSIDVTSEEGIGTSFTVKVDAGETSEKAARDKLVGERPVEVAPTTCAAERPLANVEVLLAEDGPDNQRLIGHVLKKAGARLEIVANGQEAVDRAREREQQARPFDVVLMDMQMPVLDGYGATELLRSYGYQRPIIALTAHAMNGDREKCIDAGCDDFATKPLNRKHLVQLVAQYAPSDERESAHVPHV